MEKQKLIEELCEMFCNVNKQVFNKQGLFNKQGFTLTPCFCAATKDDYPEDVLLFINKAVIDAIDRKNKGEEMTTAETHPVMLFYGDQYYPSGGWKDYRGTYPTVEAAWAATRGESYDWVQVVGRGTVDSDTNMYILDEWRRDNDKG